MAKETRAGRLTRTQARTARRERRHRRKKYIKMAALSGIGLVATLLIVSLFLPSLNFNFGGIGSGSGPGQSVPIQGKEHIPVGQSHPPYNSTPPTSGWHYEDLAAWGAYTDPVPDEIQVHNLEEGGVLVQYNCPEGCDELVQQLTEVVNRYQSLVIVAPYPGMAAKIALTAWGWIDELEDFDEARIVDFINGHANGIHK